MSNIKPILKSIYHMLPISIRLGASYKSMSNFYSQAQWWPQKEIETWQLRHLQNIITYAYNFVPGYNQLYREARVHPKDIRKIKDISILPFTSKSLFQNNLKDFTSTFINKRNMSYSTTSGSTGRPMGFYNTRLNSSIESAFIHSAWKQTGWSINDIGIVLRGAFIGSPKQLFSKVEKGKFALSLYFLTENTYSSYIDFIVQKKPSFLHAYPSSAADFAKMIIRHGDTNKLSIRSIFLGSESILEWQKKIIRKAFPNAKLIGWYGHTEKAIWAPWCEQSDKYHVCPFYGQTELIGADNKEVPEFKIGELVGTSFWMKATPFIRYKTKDYATKGGLGCSKCGRNFRLLESIEGRLQELIVSKTGRCISMTSINMHDDTFDYIVQFRFIQKKIGELTLKMIPSEGYNDAIQQKIHQSLSRKLGNDFLLKIETVKTIERTISGKHTFLQQYLNINNTNWDLD